MSRRFAAAFVAFAVAGCAPRAIPVPPNVAFGGRPALPLPVTPASASASPKILAAWLSTGDIARGHTWSGQIVTTTNVASVEVRTNLFSINVPRRTFGHFAFTLRVLDLPPIFIRAYELRIIARNAAGVAAEEDLPLRIR